MSSDCEGQKDRGTRGVEDRGAILAHSDQTEGLGDMILADYCDRSQGELKL